LTPPSYLTCNRLRVFQRALGSHSTRGNEPKRYAEGGSWDSFGARAVLGNRCLLPTSETMAEQGSFSRVSSSVFSFPLTTTRASTRTASLLLLHLFRQPSCPICIQVSVKYCRRSSPIPTKAPKASRSALVLRSTTRRRLLLDDTRLSLPPPILSPPLVLLTRAHVLSFSPTKPY